MENVTLHTDPDEYIQPVGDGGKSVGGAYLFGDSREEIWKNIVICTNGCLGNILLDEAINS